MAGDAARLTLLVSRLLDLARADMAEASGGSATDPAIPLRRVADACTREGFAVTLALPQSLPAVAIAPQVIEAVVAGLLDNSRQAGASTATLTVRALADMVELIVGDDGPGVPPGDRERVFEPFFTGRRAAGGTGLGLPIARSLLHAHGGSIALDDGAAGAGAVFRIRIRAAPR
jgi:signal transduction histidine kinase